jgi:HK97 family phage prohead protease
MKIEKRFLTHRVELRGEGEEERIVGTASVTYDGTPDTEYELWDDRAMGGVRMVERIMPDAFAGRMKDDVRALFNHDPSQLLGRTASKTLKLRKDDDGLHYEISPGNTTVAADVREHLRRGDITGSSFAFTVSQKGQRFKEDGDTQIREITKVEALFDVGPVTYPAYEGTAAGVRDGADLEQARNAFVAQQAEQEQIQAAHERYDARCRELGIDIG